jgi:cytidine deaminase
MESPVQKNKITGYPMLNKTIHIPIEEYENIQALEKGDQVLLHAARLATEYSYAPYSKFRVGVALRLSNGQLMTGTNQENASFPAGICAERVALSAASSVYPGIAIETLAVSYFNESGDSSHPVSPCGICRQTLSEYEQRFGQTIRLVLGGNSGPVYIIRRSSDLLPLAFNFK